VDDIRSTLTRSGFSGFSIEKHAARLVIRGIADPEAAARCCAKVFGVVYAAPATLLPASMNEVTEAITRVAEKNLGTGQSFAIRAHRSQPSPLSRREVEVQGGSVVLSALQNRTVKVDLKHPDLTILVDLAGDRAYVYRDKLAGPGGLPLSSQWKMLGVLDSGPLSILAAYTMMRRGCLVELLIPISQKKALFQKERQLRYAKALGERVARPNYKAFILDFDAQTHGRIDELAGAECRQLARTMAMRLAEVKKFRGLVFSDVVGQISADSRLRVTTLPVFTPLIGMDRGDLLELCEMTGVAQDELLLQLESEEDTSRAVTTVIPEFDVFADGVVQEFPF
jgi:thiamine biosynthesis protein ThiI